MAGFSKTSIDRLGDRLRQGAVTAADLRALDEYRRSFGEAYESVVLALRERLQLEPTGRPAKSTASIVEKLNRESIRLVQVQDIAGCRVVVGEAVEQERVVAAIQAMLPSASVVDRRAKPSHGYRAVHVIVHVAGKSVEVQVRTSLQHLWAELSEKLSDTADPAIKYGGGPEDVKQLLKAVSQAVAGLEAFETQVPALNARLARLPQGDRREKIESDLIDLQKKMTQARNAIGRALVESLEMNTGPKP